MISLLLTKNCHYAILVAIEEGDQFRQQDDKEIYVKAYLDFPYSDDIIPINSTLCTPFTPLTSDKPQFKSTLVYYISNQYLRRLRKKQSLVTLEVFRLSMDSTEELLGTVELKVTEAKEVVMKKGERRMAQIERFVGDKGEWRPIGDELKTKAKLKCGLFLVEMPHSSALAAEAASSALDLTQHLQQPQNGTSTVERSEQPSGMRSPTSTVWSATPSAIPYQQQQAGSTGSRASSGLGLELRSQPSETLRASDNDSSNNSVTDLLSPVISEYPSFVRAIEHEAARLDNNGEHDEDSDYDKMPELMGLSHLQEEPAITADGSKYFAVGTGRDQYALQIRVLNASHIASIVGKFVNSPDMIQKAYFSFSIAEVDYECPVDFIPEDNDGSFKSDTWSALDNLTTILFQGDVDDIHDWLAESPLILQLMLKLPGQDEEIDIAAAKFYLEDVGVDITKKAGILYDKELNWYTNAKMQFAKLEIEVSLTEGWDDNLSTI